MMLTPCSYDPIQGHSFFEVVSPTKSGVAGARFLDRHGEAAGYMLEVQGEQIVRVRVRVRVVSIAQRIHIHLDVHVRASMHARTHC